MTLEAGAGLAGKVLQADRPMMTEDYGAVGRPPSGSPWAGVEASVAVPVHWGGQLRGVLSVAYWHAVRLTRRHMDALEAFAELAAVAFQNASAHATLARAARTDPLTGCLNHAALHEGLARELDRAERGQGATLSLILLDLDRFKAVNDEHGHLVGDEVLRRVGHALRSTTRPYDLAARYGGDEFALIAVEADESQAIEIAARAIERISLALGDLAEAGGARATAGVAEWSTGLTAGDLIARADRALLYGKRADRRGEVLCSSDLPSTFLPSRAGRRDRRLPLQPPAVIPQWTPRTDDDAAERLRKRTRQLAIANQLGARLAAMTDVREIHGAVVEELHEAFDYFLCAVIRIREDGDVESAAGRGEAFVRLGDAAWRQPFGHGLIGRCLRTRRPVCVGDVYAQPEYHPTPETESRALRAVRPAVRRRHAVRRDQRRERGRRRVRRGRRPAPADGRRPGRRRDALRRPLRAARARVPGHGRGARRRAGGQGRVHRRPRARRSPSRPRRSAGAWAWTRPQLRDLRLGAVFHDIGKIAVPEAILNKPGPLTPAERDVMERHTVVGEQILAPVEFLAGVCRLVRHEHERWDGGGYPDGLGGEEIPLGSRIILACDAFHAMTSDRPYRRALPEGVAHAELRRNAGTQFDPAVVDALLAEIGAAQREPVIEQ